MSSLNDDASSTKSKSPRSSISTRATQSTPATSPEDFPIALPQAQPQPQPQAMQPFPGRGHSFLDMTRSASSSDSGDSVRSALGTSAPHAPIAANPAAGPSRSGNVATGAPVGSVLFYGDASNQQGAAAAPYGGGNNVPLGSGHYGGENSQAASPTSPRFPHWQGMTPTFAAPSLHGRDPQTPARQSSGLLTPETRARQELLHGGAYPSNPDALRRGSDALPRPSETQYDTRPRSKSAGDGRPKPRQG